MSFGWGVEVGKRILFFSFFFSFSCLYSSSVNLNLLKLGNPYWPSFCMRMDSLYTRKIE